MPFRIWSLLFLIDIFLSVVSLCGLEGSVSHIFYLGRSKNEVKKSKNPTLFSKS